MVPGTSRLSDAKLRPLSGSSVSLVELSTSPVWVDSVCSMGAMSLISTDSVTWPTSSLRSTRAV